MKKTCCTCKVEKELKEFSKNRTSRDGLGNKCKECVNKYNKEYNPKYYLENRKVVIEILPSSKKRCFKCKEIKERSEFPKNLKAKDNLNPQCKVCRKEYHDSTKERDSKRNKLHYLKHKERIDKADALREDLNLASWKGFIPLEANCEICNKIVYFRSGDRRTSLNFDHRNEGKEAIKGVPYNWLQKRKRTPENELIWKSCNFGILCGICNLRLPTMNRLNFLEKAIKYTKKGRLKCN